MPQRSPIEQLPDDVLSELDKKIVEKAFGGYRELSSWLALRGYSISKSALHVHGQRLKSKLEAIKRATDAAKAINAASPDEEGALNDALVRMVQQVDFEVLMQLQDDGLRELDPKALSAINRSIASIVRAQVQQKRWMVETRERVQAGVAGAEQQVAAAQKSGLTDEAAQKIREALLHIKV